MSTRKKAIFILMVFGVGFFVTGILIAKSEAAPKILIKAVSAWPLNHVGNDYYKEYIKRVNEKSKGEIEIKLLGGPEVVAVPDLLKAAAGGVVDMIHCDSNWYAGIVPEGTIYALLHKFGPVELRAFQESGIDGLFNEAYLEKKVVLLGHVWMGMPYYIMTKKPVSKLEDIRGLKLRSWGGLLDVLFGELGVSVARIPSAETYEALQRGVVDGAIRNTISLVEFKEYEVMKYIISPPITADPSEVYLGEGKWNAIPKNLQALMKALMVEIEGDANKYYYDMDKARLKEVEEKHGMKIIYLDDKDIAKLKEARTGATIKDWIYKKAPKFGPQIYEKMLPYLK